MREIKFRAWDEGLRKMIYFDLKSANDTVDCTIYENIMQYAGLKDKNGNELYEEDIIRYKTEFDAEATGIGVVRWSKFTPGFAPMAEGFVEYGTMKVIGNTHENSELLRKGGKEWMKHTRN